MADKMMRIAARTSGGTAKPVLAGSDGEIVINRPWKTEIITLFDSVLTTTDRSRVTDYDLSKYPIVSLRVQNDTGVPVTIEMLDDTAVTGRFDLDSTGAYEIKTFPNSAQIYYITPTDMPLLSCIYKFRAFVKATETPNGTGSFKIYAVVKY